MIQSTKAASARKRPGAISLIPAAGYLRCSGDKQDTSVSSQRDAIVAWALENGFRIVRWFIDDGVEGWKNENDRRGFDKMIKASSRGEFKAIIVWKKNRFSRFLPRKFMKYASDLCDQGVYIWTMDKGKYDPDNISEYIVGGVEQQADHDYCAKLAEDVMRGQLSLARQGYCVGRPPFGYALGAPEFGDKGRRLVLGAPEEIALVKRIFALFVSGKSPDAIAKLLNREKVKTLSAMRGYRKRKGMIDAEGAAIARDKRPCLSQHWRANAIIRIVANDVYIGTFRWGRENRAQFVTNDEVIVIPKNHEPIIENHVFAKAARELKRRQCENKKRSPRVQNRHGRSDLVLSGLLVCDWCGGNMVASPVRSTTEPVAYQCRRSHVHGLGVACPGNKVTQAEVLPTIVNTIVSHFSGDAARKKMRKALLDVLSPKVDAADLDRKVKELEKEVSQRSAVLGVASVEDYPMLSKQLKEVRESLEHLKTQQKATKSESAISREVNQLVSDAMQSFEDLRSAMAAADWGKLRSLLASVVREVRIKSRRVIKETGSTMVWNLTPQGEDLTTGEISELLTSNGLVHRRSTTVAWLHELVQKGSAKVVKAGAGKTPTVWRMTSVSPKDTGNSVAYELERGRIFINDPCNLDTQNDNTTSQRSECVLTFEVTRAA